LADFGWAAPEFFGRAVVAGFSAGFLEFGGGGDEVFEEGDLLVGLFGGEDGCRICPDVRAIGGRVFVDGEEAVYEAVGGDVGFHDAEAGVFGGRADPAEGADGEVEVPGEEAEFLGGGVEVEIEVVAGGEEAVGVGQERGHGEEAEEFIDVEHGTDLFFEGGIVGFGDQLAELDDAFFLVFAGLILGAVFFVVALPLLAVGHDAAEEASGFMSRPLPDLKCCLRKSLSTSSTRV